MTFKADQSLIDQLSTAVEKHLAEIGSIGFGGDFRTFSSTGFPTVDGKSYVKALESAASYRGGRLNGWSRLAFSNQENAVHDYASTVLLNRGFSVRRDGFGNLYGRKGDDRLPAIMLGTHLDTVPDGGNYDGVVGFISAIESIALAEESGPLPTPVEVAIFRAEESTRFSQACLGSQAAFGFLATDELRNRKFEDEDYSVVSLGEAMKRAGFEPTSAFREILDRSDYLAYLETHIEQARYLEEIGKLGVVTSIRAPERREVKVSGRRAAKAVSTMVLAIEWICRKYSYIGKDIVGTVGKVQGFFGGADSINKVPGHVSFHLLDFDHAHFCLLESIAEAKGVRLAESDPAWGRRLEVIGQTDHSGGTPMGKSIRRDALVAASEMLLEVEDRHIAPCDIVFSIDLRSNLTETRAMVSAEIVSELKKIAHDFDVSLAPGDPTENVSPVTSLSTSLRSCIQAYAEELKIGLEAVPSGAGHDAMYAHKAGIPTAMIFVPSFRGLSHTPEEFTKTGDIVAAIVLQSKVLSNWRSDCIGR